MIRVVLRHVDDVEGVLLGDFPPSELDELVARVRSDPIYSGDGDPAKPLRIEQQWVLAEPPATPRWCYELIWD